MNNARRIVLLAVKPVYAQKIKVGEKTLELRRTAPIASVGDIIVIYESSPIQRVTAYCEIKDILSDTPDLLWEVARDTACIDKADYNKYFRGKKIAHGLVVKNIVLLKEPKKLAEILDMNYVPQNYCYLQEKEFERVIQ